MMPFLRRTAPSTSFLASIILLPYGYYFYLLFTVLVPVQVADGFAYVWTDPINLYYFTGRSLTQRVLFSLLSNDLMLIAVLQLSAFLVLMLALFLFMRRGKYRIDLPLAIFLCALSSSPNFSLLAAVVSADPLFAVLLILFVAASFMCRRPAQALVVLVVGSLFVFSKSTAPYVALLGAGLIGLFRLRTLPRSYVAVWLVLVCLAVSSIWTTSRFDTSRDINVANNVFARVFPYPERVAHFRDKYGMPTGSFVESCKGENVNAPCFGGVRIYGAFRFARNYALTTNGGTFSKWIVEHGGPAFVRFLILDRPLETMAEFWKEWEFHFTHTTTTYGTDYLGYPPDDGTPSNLALLRELGVMDEVGFLVRLDPLLLIQRILAWFGFAVWQGVTCWLVVGICLHSVARRMHAVALEIVEVSLAGMVCALGLFFVSLFGDGMEINRHVYVSLILFCLAAFLLLVSLVSVGFDRLRRASPRTWNRSRICASASAARC